MIKYLIKRITGGIFVIFGLSVFIFILIRVVPGDPVRVALGPNAPDYAVKAMRLQMHLDKPLVVQYFYWIVGVLHGDFGQSLTTKRPVALDVIQFLPATLEVALFSGLIFVVFSILIGLAAANHRDTWLDGFIRACSYVGISIPSFVLAILLLLVFGCYFKILPVVGRVSSNFQVPTVTGFMVLDCLIGGSPQAALDALAHMVIPAVSLAVGCLFQESRLLRSSLIDNMHNEFYSVERGYGLPKSFIIRKYLFKPSFIPVISVMGLDFASLMGNAFLVETVFGWPGISRYGMNAMLNKDLNAVSAVIIIYGTIFVIVNIIVDIIAASLDPRTRMGSR